MDINSDFNLEKRIFELESQNRRLSLALSLLKSVEQTEETKVPEQNNQFHKEKSEQISPEKHGGVETEGTNTAQQKLKHSDWRKKYEILFEAVHEGLILFDENLEMLKTNQRAFALLSATRAIEHELVDKENILFCDTCKQCTLCEIYKLVQATFATPNEIHEQQILSNVYATKENTVSKIGVTAQFDGQHVLLFIEDLSNNTLTTYRLKESNEKFYSIFNHAPYGIVFTDEIGQIIELNLAFAKMIGFKPSDLVGTNLLDLTFPEDIERDVHTMEAMKTGTKQEATYEKRFIHRNKEIRWSELKISILPLNEKGLHHFVVVVNDTTERHNLQEQIEERQLMLNLFFEQSLEGFFFMNFANSQHLEEQLSLEQKIQYSYENLIITRNNRALEMLYGYDESQMIGLSMKSLFSLDSDLAKELLGNLFTTGNAKPDTKHIHKNGFMLRFEGNYIILRNRKQRVIGIFGIQRDISEKHRTIELLKHQNRKINESNNAKDNFFSIIAHDLKSPFNAIYGFSQLIAEAGNNKDFSQVVAYSEHIVKASQFSVELIDNLLEWARTQRDGIYIETTKVNIGEVMQQISNLMAIQYTSKEVELRVKIPENCTINADKNMIFTILRNLCSNALKFSFPNSIVEMIVIQNAIQTEVTISDTGIGMTSSEIALLFGNENKTMKPGTANEKGTGLGLKLCYEFVKMHGGEIWAESTPGLGSSFHFTIPSTPQEA